MRWLAPLLGPRAPPDASLISARPLQALPLVPIVASTCAAYTGVANAAALGSCPMGAGTCTNNAGLCDCTVGLTAANMAVGTCSAVTLTGAAACTPVCLQGYTATVPVVASSVCAAGGGSGGTATMGSCIKNAGTCTNNAGLCDCTVGLAAANMDVGTGSTACSALTVTDAPACTPVCKSGYVATTPIVASSVCAIGGGSGGTATLGLCNKNAGVCTAQASVCATNVASAWTANAVTGNGCSATQIAGGVPCTPACNTGYTSTGGTLATYCGTNPAAGATADILTMVGTCTVNANVCNSNVASAWPDNAVAGSGCSATQVVGGPPCTPVCGPGFISTSATLPTTCAAGASGATAGVLTKAGTCTAAPATSICDSSVVGAWTANAATGPGCIAQQTVGGAPCTPVCASGYYSTGVALSTTCAAGASGATAGAITKVGTCTALTTVCDCVTVLPASLAAGTCTVNTPTGAGACQPVCASSYTIGGTALGTATCPAGTAPAKGICTPPTTGACTANSCAANVAPTNGALGTCSSTGLSNGAACTMTCTSLYTVSGLQSCSLGVLTAATCILTTSVCNPVSDLTLGTTVANSAVGACTTVQGPGATCKGACALNFSPTTPVVSACASSRRTLGSFVNSGVCTSNLNVCDCSSATIPTNGNIGTCTALQVAGMNCAPACNTGYTATTQGVVVCTSSTAATGPAPLGTCSTAIATVCGPNPCDATKFSYTANNAVGTCTSSQASGTTCAPGCAPGYSQTTAGSATCTLGVFAVVTPAVCAAVTTTTITTTTLVQSMTFAATIAAFPTTGVPSLVAPLSDVNFNGAFYAYAVASGMGTFATATQVFTATPGVALSATAGRRGTAVKFTSTVKTCTGPVASCPTTTYASAATLATVQNTLGGGTTFATLISSTATQNAVTGALTIAAPTGVSTVTPSTTSTQVGDAGRIAFVAVTAFTTAVIAMIM